MERTRPTLHSTGNYSLANFTASSDGHGGTFVIDPPAAPTIASFSTDSGVVGDGITNDNTPTLTGTAPANSTVQVYDGSTLLGTTTANSSGAWTYTTGQLSNGTHQVTATATTSSGSTSSPFPNASTTGVPAGTTLTTVNGDFTSSSAGQVIDGLNVTGQIIIDDPGVTVRNCRAMSVAILAQNVTVEYCDFIGIVNGGSDNSDVGIGSTGATVQFCDLSGTENGFYISAGNCLIQNNYIHDLSYPAPDPHIDGLQIDAANNITIEHNNFDLNIPRITSDIIMPAGTSNITIDNNRLLSSNYAVYLNGTGLVVTNNVFGADVAGNNFNTASYSGNVDLNGNPFFPPAGLDQQPTTTTTTSTSSTTSAASAALSVTIDTVAPNAPVITSNTIVNSNQVTVNGTAEANSAVKVFDGATQVGTATANGSGAWNFTTGALAVGAHNFTATATDKAGNTSGGSQLTSVTIASAGQAAPVITSFSTDTGTAGDGITSDNTLTLTGTATANSTVKVFDGATQIGTASANASGAWTYATPGLADGAHSITATATGTSGGASTASPALAVTVDTVAPNAPVITGDTISGTDQVTLAGTAEANSTVKAYEGTTLLGTTSANGSGAWSFTTGSLSTGNHEFTATSTDAAGNTSALSQPIDPVIGSNVPAPTIASFSADSGTPGDGITNDNTPTLTGTAPANSTVQVYDGSTLLGTTTANSSGAWTYTTGQLSNGTHQITATATTSSGTSSPFPNASTTGVPAGTTLTTVNGNVTSSSAGQVIEGLNVTGEINIDDPGVIVRNCRATAININAPNVIVEYCDAVGGTSNNSAMSILGGDGSTIRYCDLSSTENGIWFESSNCLIENNYIHNLYYNIPDPHIDGIQLAGNSTGDIIRHNNIDLDTTTTTSCIIMPSTTANLTIDSNRFNGGAFEVYVNGTGINLTNNVFGAYTFGFIGGNSAPATNTGNIFDGTAAAGTTTTTTSSTTSAASAPLSITIDTQAPAAPAIASFSTDSGTAGDRITNDNTLTLTGTAAANSTVKVFDGATLLGSVVANSSGAWSYTTAALPNGTHSLTATATDVAGNTGAASTALSVTIDTTAPSTPTIASFSPDTGTVGDGSTTANVLTLTGTAEANATVKVFDGATLLGSAVANSSGAWTYTTATLANATHSFTATATDVAGNTGAASAALAVTVTAPLGAPTITSFSPDTGVVGDGITDPAILTLTGTAVANSTVNVYDGTTLLGTATANASGAWSFVIAALPDGLHRFTATDTMSGVTSAASAVMSVTVDTVAPAAPTIASFSTDSGTVGDHITNDTTPTLTGTAEANSTVKVYDGATLLGSTVANSSGAWSYTTAALTNGAHSLTATASDVAANTSAASAALAVTIDTQAPSAPVIASDTIVNTDEVMLTGTASQRQSHRIRWRSVARHRNHGRQWCMDLYDGSTFGGPHAFTATATDAAGNISPASQVFDPIVGGTDIEANGAISLVQVGNQYYLEDNTGVVPPLLKYLGAGYAAGQFGVWTPIAAEKTATGYEVAWKFGSADQYTVWNTDSNGNYVSGVIGAVSSSSAALELFESSFHQDLNGDGVIGISPTVIEAAGATSLTEVGTTDFLFDSAGAGPSLKYGGANYTLGEFGAWTPIGAEKTATGYEIAWKNGSADQYTVWNVDNNGNYVSGVFGAVSSSSTALQSFESSFHQDLNGDGLSGISPTVIEAAGATSLTEVGATYFLYDSITGAGPSLKYGGANYASGEFGAWTPIGAEGTATGYEIAWKNGSADQYTVWNVDSNGNYVSGAVGAVSGTSMQSFETSFLQELNGDGKIGSSLVVNGPAGGGTVTSTAANEVLFGNGGSDTFVFSGTTWGTDIVADFHPTADVVQLSQAAFANLAAVLSHATQVGTDVVITADAMDSITLKNTTLSHLTTNNIHIV